VAAKSKESKGGNPPGDDEARRYMIYKGLREGGKGKKHYAWTTLKTNDLDAPLEGEDHWYSKQVQRSAVPGCVYEMTLLNGGSSIRMQSGRWIGMHDDEDYVAELQAEHSAISTSFDIKGKAASERRRRFDLERLEPIRTAYWDLKSGRQRAALLAEVVKTIMQPNRIKGED